MAGGVPSGAPLRVSKEDAAEVGERADEKGDIGKVGGPVPGFEIRSAGSFIRIDLLGRGAGFDTVKVTGRFEVFDVTVPAGELEDRALPVFRDEVRGLYERLAGTATLTALEGWLQLQLEGSRAGHVTVTGYLTPPRRNSPENRLEFVIRDYDQSFLPGLLADLDDTTPRG